jgi:chromosome segregation ATPase
VTIPRTYCDDPSASNLIAAAGRLKVTAKRLAKYEFEYLEMKAAEAEAQDPMTRLQDDNTRLQAQVMRLETENELMATDLVTSKIESQSEIERLDVSLNASNRAVDALTTRLAELQKETDEEKERLLAEGAQVLCRCRGAFFPVCVLRRVQHISVRCDADLLSGECFQVKDMFRVVIAEGEASKAAVETQRDEAERRLKLETARFETDRDKLEDLAKLGEASKALKESGAGKLALQNEIHTLENELAESKSQLGERAMRIEELEQKLRAVEADLVSIRAHRTHTLRHAAHSVLCVCSLSLLCCPGLFCEVSFFELTQLSGFCWCR